MDISSKEELVSYVQGSDRRSLQNFRNVLPDGTGTVEFRGGRHLSGPVRPERWVTFTVLFVDFATRSVSQPSSLPSIASFPYCPVLDIGKIYAFDFTALDGTAKWTAYKLTKNLYDLWMPTHLKIVLITRCWNSRSHRNLRR